MDPASKRIHFEVISEVRGDIEEIENKLKELKAVEAYHQRKIDEHNMHGDLKQSPQHDGETGRFSDMMRHEAAEIILRESGKPLKTADIAAIFISDGDESDHSKLHNAVFTAMNRKRETFQKHGPGLWALLEWDKDDGEDDNK